MQRVVVERTFEEPAEFADLQAREDAAAWCARTRRVRFLHSFFSRDRRHMVCLYEAPDAESVRTFQRTAEMPVSHLYPVHKILDDSPPRPPGYSLAVAQRAIADVPDVSIELIRYMAGDPKGCNQRLRLHHFGAYLSHDLKRMICAYYTPDLESVRRANRETGTPYEHLWTGELFAAAE